jgi:hypothetical protein
MKKITILIISIILISTLAVIPASGDQFIFDKEMMEEYLEIGERDLVVYQDTYSADISSYMKEKEDELFFDFSITADSELWIGANYGRYNGGGFESSGMQVRFLSVVEYLDADKNGEYDPNNDELISGMPLSSDFYYSDMANAAGDFVDIKWDDDASIWDPYDWNYALMEVYNAAFMTGWEYGYQQGLQDLELDYPYNPDPNSLLMDPFFLESLMELINSTLIGMDEEYLFEAYDWAFTGLNTGFMFGYDQGYGIYFEPMDDENPYNKTRSPPPKSSEEEFPFPFGMDPGNMGFYPSKYLSIYDPVEVSHVEFDNGTEEVTVEIWDVDGIFGIKCKVTNMFAMIENGYLSPTSMKIDIMIENYPYVRQDTDIAVLMDWGVTSMSTDIPELEYHEDSYYQTKGLSIEEEEYRMGSSSFKGFLSWVKYAHCDGERKEVKVSSHNSFYGDYIDQTGGYSENFKSVVISYPRSQFIIHDPKIGFIEIQGEDILTDLTSIEEISRALKGNIAVYIIISVSIAVFVGITWKRRGASK